MSLPDHLPRIAYITSGAAGMYCGSCMRDNTLAASLSRLGVDIQLIPTYTPIRTDEQNVTIDHVFFGGINIYLQQKIPLFRLLPNWVDRWLDSPAILRWATSRGMQTSPQQLGKLAVSMLRGTAGHQRKEVGRLSTWLAKDVRPQLINLSNMLIGGMVPALKKTLGVPIVATLQGDDVFLDYLPEPYRSDAFTEIRRLVESVDAFIVFSRYYADFMSDYFSIPPSKIHIVPLGIDVRDFAKQEPDKRNNRPLTIGYLARLAPEKGLHQLVDAFCLLKQMPGCEETRLQIAGYLGDDHREYAEQQFAKLREAGLEDAFHYAGVIDRQEKTRFLAQLDLFSVPTTYREPKGLFVLESLAAGVPVVQPDHGAFPELLAATGGGQLVRPGDTAHLAETLAELLRDPAKRQLLGEQGRTAVHRDFHADAAAQATLDVYRQFLGSSGVSVLSHHIL